MHSTLAWWIAGPILGLVIVGFLALANTRFGVVGGVTDLVEGSAEGKGLRSWRTLLLLGIVVGGTAYALLAGAPDAGGGYSWLDAHLSLGGEVAVLFGAGVAIGVGARTAGGCTSGHGLTGSALLSPATAAQLGAGRVLAVTVAAGVLVGVKLQPRLVAAIERARQRREVAPVVHAAEVL